MASVLEGIQTRKIRNGFQVSDICTWFQLVWQSCCVLASKYLDLSRWPVLRPIDIIGKSGWLITDLGMSVEFVQRANLSILPFSKEHFWVCDDDDHSLVSIVFVHSVQELRLESRWERNGKARKNREERGQMGYERRSGKVQRRGGRAINEEGIGWGNRGKMEGRGEFKSKGEWGAGEKGDGTLPHVPREVTRL